MAKLYRVLRNLDGPKRGSVLHPGTMLVMNWLPERNVKQLVEMDALSEVTAPPLEILPDWEKRALRLKKVAIITAADLLVLDSEVLAKQIHTTRERVEGWKTEVKEWLNPPARQG